VVVKRMMGKRPMVDSQLGPAQAATMSKRGEQQCQKAFGSLASKKA